MKNGKRYMLLLLAAVLLVACAPAGAEAEPEKTKLSLWYYLDGQESRMQLLQLVDEYNRANPQIEVVASYVPDEDFKKTLALAIADGQMPDLAIVDSSDVQYYNSMQSLTDLSEYVDTEAYLNVALASCVTGEGELVGLPLGVNCLVFYYNTDLLEAAGVPVPETVDELIDAAGRVSGDHVYGCAFPSLQSEESIFCFLPVLWSEGGSLMEVDSRESRAAFDVLRRLVANGGMSRDTVNMTLMDISNEFVAGNLAMMFCTSGREEQIRRVNPELHFTVSELPLGDQGISVAGGEVLTVLDTEHQQEAVSFVRYMAEPEQIRSYIGELCYLSPREDLLEWQIGVSPEMQKYAEYLKHARVRDFKAYWPALSVEVSEAINQVILGEDDANTFDELEKRLNQIREDEYEKR